MFEAVVFDFDGLILDTETPLYVAWAKTFQHFGLQPIGLPEWSVSLGLHDDDPAMLDPMERLRELLGRPLAEADVQPIRRAFRDELLDAMSVRPGVETLLDEAEKLGVPVAIASSSPVAWIEEHLEPTGLLERFAVLSCAGHGVPGKPDPAVYLQACGAVGADPRRSLALEDSPNGAAAAKRAGMTCVVVPTEISRTLDLTDTQWQALKSAWGECAYCGVNDKSLQRDCVLPLSRGGRYTLENVVPACPSCNASKCNHEVTSWMPHSEPLVGLDPQVPHFDTAFDRSSS